MDPTKITLHMLGNALIDGRESIPILHQKKQEVLLKIYLLKSSIKLIIKKILKI